MADYEFKNKNNNVKKIIKEIKEVVEVEVKEEVVKTFKTKNPTFVWSNPKPKKHRNLNEALESFEDEHKERCSGVKSEFVSKGQLNKLALERAKKKVGKDRKED